MTYYALADMENGGLMHSGRNDTTLEDLAESLLSYYSGDHPASNDPQDLADWEAMQKMSAEELAELGQFEIVTQIIPWPEEA